MAPVSGPSKGWRSWSAWGPGRGAPRGGGGGRTRLLRAGPAGGTEARGRRPGARARRGLGPTRRPPPRGRGRGARAGPARPGPAASPGCCPELVPRPAVLGGGGGGGEKGKEEGRRERRKGTAEGRGGVAAEEAGAAGPGGQRKGEPEPDAAAAGANAEEPLRRPQPGRK